MTAYLLDTNIISELMNPAPNSDVINFLSQVTTSYLSTITLHELHYGLNLLPEGQRKNALANRLQYLLVNYSDSILPITHFEAKQAALLRAQAKQQGYIVHLADVLIASTAKVHSLIVATRNTKDFIHLGIDIINPWQTE